MVLAYLPIASNYDLPMQSFQHISFVHICPKQNHPTLIQPIQCGTLNEVEIVSLVQIRGVNGSIQPIKYHFCKSGCNDAYTYISIPLLSVSLLSLVCTFVSTMCLVITTMIMRTDNYIKTHIYIYVQTIDIHTQAYLSSHLSQGAIFPFEEINLIQQEMLVKLRLVPDPNCKLRPEVTAMTRKCCTNEGNCTILKTI